MSNVKRKPYYLGPINLETLFIYFKHTFLINSNTHS